MTDNHLFSNILLGGRDGTNPGQLKVHPGGIAWRKQGGGKIIEIDKADIARVTCMEVPRAYQLGVGLKDGLFYKFIGFREQDVSNLTNFIQKNIGVTPEEKQLSTSGHNWGEVDINGNMLTFLVGSRQAFEISLADVAQTQLQGKTDVHMEFHVDDTTGATERTVQCGASRLILASSRFNQPHTFVIITLDPPIRKGQTLYPHIVIQYVVERELALNEELLTTRYKDKLEPSYKGLIHDVFTKILRGLSGVKVTRLGSFRSCQDGYAVKSSLKAEGLLYPLEKGFFFLRGPPTLILHDEIEFVEFERHGARGSSVSSHYFDLLIKLKNEQEHLFRNIQMNEYHNLFEFIKGKGMKILNLGDAKTTSGVTAALQDDDDDAVDPHLERIKNAAGEESDEEDEDFVAEKDDGGSPTDDSGKEESDASESGNEKVFLDKIVSLTDVGSSEEAVVTFEGIAILTPRGRYSVELHVSFLRLQGLVTDFKIQYSSVARLFVLPKFNQPHAFVIITLDPPIRKGQTLHSHIVIQFETEYVVERELALNEELLTTRYTDKLEPSYKGLIHDVFTKILRGLSGVKVTRPGSFRSCQDGYAVKSSLKAEGLLYPLEKGFFFLPRPLTLILHDEIEFVEFKRHGAGGSSVSSHYFDLLVKLKNEQEHLFRNIQRNTSSSSLSRGKGMKILNLGDAKTTSGVTAALQDDDDDAMDPHLERIKNAAGEESDEEDEDFVAEKDDGGSPTDDSGEEESDASESGNEKKSSNKDTKKEASGVKVVPSKKKSNDGDDESSKKRKPKRKKDPNAPKRAMSGFMFFSNAERENLKKSNPGMSFTDVGRALGERWKKMSAEEKEPYDSMARADTKRYREAMADYKSGGAIDIDSGNDSD